MRGCRRARIMPLYYQNSLYCRVAFFSVLWLFLIASTSYAQAFKGSIVVEPEIWAPPANATPLRIRIESAEAIPPQVMLVVRNVPVTIRLSEGRPFGPGVWVLPLNSLSRVNVLTPAESGRADFQLALVALDGTALAEAKVTLHITSNSPQKMRAPAETPQTQAAHPRSEALTTPPAKKQVSALDRAAAAKLLEKGDASLAGGNVSIAREFYKRAANMGLADAALAMGATYDAQELPRMQNVVGVQADSAQAKKWYEIARDLGSEHAAVRLRRFD